MRERVVGQGVSAIVFEVCRSKDLEWSEMKKKMGYRERGQPCPYVVKVMDMGRAFHKLQQELYIATIAGIAGVGPRVLDFWTYSFFEGRDMFWDERPEDVPIVFPPYIEREKRKYIDSGTYLFILMDKVPGQTVDSLTKQLGVLAWWRIPGLDRAITNVLRKMSQLGINHRDLHRNNVMVEKKTGEDTWEVKIIDFGGAELSPNPLRSDFNILT